MCSFLHNPFTKNSIQIILNTLDNEIFVVGGWNDPTFCVPADGKFVELGCIFLRCVVMYVYVGVGVFEVFSSIQANE